MLKGRILHALDNPDSASTGKCKALLRRVVTMLTRMTEVKVDKVHEEESEYGLTATVATLHTASVEQ